MFVCWEYSSGNLRARCFTLVGAGGGSCERSSFSTRRAIDKAIADPGLTGLRIDASEFGADGENRTRYPKFGKLRLCQ
jgi:hypothetical protein